MRIGELAERTGVSVRSLRYYESRGMLFPDRTTGGQRVYAEAAVDRVRRIQELIAAGLTSRTIVQILPCMRDADGGPKACANPQLVDTLVSERDRIDRTIADLRRSRRLLDEVIATARAD